MRRIPAGALLRQQLVGAALGAFSVSIFHKVMMLVVSILLARGLGAQGYGVYSSALALIAVLGVPTTLGLPTLVTRMLASYQVREQWALMRGLLQRANHLVLRLAVLIGAAGVALLWILGERLPALHATTLLWAMAVLPFAALAALRTAALSGLRHVLLGQIPDKLVAPVLFIVLLGVWQWYRPDMAPTHVMGMYLIVVASAFAVGTWLLAGRLPDRLRDAQPEYDMEYWKRSAMPLLLLGGMGIINTHADVLMLTAIMDAEAVGLYQVAVRGADLVVFSLVIVNVVIQPTISRLYALGDLQRLQRMITIAARGTLLVALPVTLAMVLFGRPILGLMFGSEFEQSALCLAILCLAQLVNVVAGPVGQILNMTGHERDSAIGMSIGAFTNIVLNAVFIPKWGIEGAALATGVGLAVWNLFLIVVVRRRTHLNSTAFTWNKRDPGNRAPTG